MTSTAAKAANHKLAIKRHQAFDVAGVDGSGSRTWTDYSPGLPDPVGEGDWSGYEYRYLFKVGDRFYVPFAAGTSYPSPDLYVYSWAVGELSWTLEWNLGGGDWDTNAWDAACDGVDVYVAGTETGEVSVECGGGVHRPGYFTAVPIFKGTTAGTWTTVGSPFGDLFNRPGGSEDGFQISLAAAATEPGNVYLAAAEGGLLPCNANAGLMHFWAQGFGATNTIPSRVYIEDSVFNLTTLTGEFPVAHVKDFQIVNDGDDVQIICRLPQNGGGPNAGFNQLTISVFKPTGFSTSPQGESHSSIGTGWDFWYENPVLQFATDDAFTKVVTPLWIENSGRRQRAIIANFAGADDVIGLDANGTTLHHFHDNTNLDSTAVTIITPDPGVEASIDETGPGGYYIPGIFYDPTADEYWAIYQNPAFRSSVTTAACGVEQWQGVSFGTAATDVLKVAQGPFATDTFYAIANTTGNFRLAPQVIAIPICRGCMECP